MRLTYHTSSNKSQASNKSLPQIIPWWTVLLAYNLYIYIVYMLQIIPWPVFFPREFIRGNMVMGLMIKKKQIYTFFLSWHTFLRKQHFSQETLKCSTEETLKCSTEETLKCSTDTQRENPNITCIIYCNLSVFYHHKAHKDDTCSWQNPSHHATHYHLIMVISSLMCFFFILSRLLTNKQ